MRNSSALLLGFVVPDALAQKLFSLDSIPAVQTHKFGWSLARALSIAFSSFYVASVCPIQSYPHGKKLIFGGGDFSESGLHGRLLAFINVPILKHFTRLFVCLIFLPRLILRRRVEWLFVHGTHTPFLLFGVLARLFGLKFVVVLTDPPGVILPTDGFLIRALKRLDVSLVSWMLSRANALMALAPDLALRYGCNKPALVFPGILDATLIEKIDAVTSAPIQVEGRAFTIVYAGGLSKAYGVDRLVEAVVSTTEIPVQLRLFGVGDQVSMVQALSAHDSRVFYGGFVSSDRLLPELLSADLLINPRPTHQLFAGLSFPSKLIEYLAVARPVLTTRIKSIPDEYCPFYYFINDESAAGIKNAFLRVYSVPLSDRMKRAGAGRDFVVSNASEAALGYKIAAFVKEF